MPLDRINSRKQDELREQEQQRDSTSRDNGTEQELRADRSRSDSRRKRTTFPGSYSSAAPEAAGAAIQTETG